MWKCLQAKQKNEHEEKNRTKVAFQCWTFCYTHSHSGWNFFLLLALTSNTFAIPICFAHYQFNDLTLFTWLGDFLNEFFSKSSINLCTFYSSNGEFCEEKQFVQIVRHIFSHYMSHRTFVKCSRTQFDYAMFSLFTQKSIFLLQLLLLFATAADLLFVLFLLSSYTWIFRAILFRSVWCFLFSSMHPHKTWKKESLA